ncbi:MAG TPA: hypothetical protein VHO43_09090 [Ignavibacteriales bacterium]|nr:hypothetical protein [Ignavibacteriales bacterium]
MRVLLKNASSFFIPLILAVYIISNSVSGQNYIEKSAAELVRSKAQFDYNGFIMNKLKEHRVVMLADEGHGQPAYLKSTIDFLKYWTCMIENNSKLGEELEYPTKLFLVLEADSENVTSIYKYFETGNPYYVLNPAAFMGNQFTTAMIEFYFELKGIHNRIETVNKLLPIDRKVTFRLFGPEKVIDLSDWSVEKRDIYFIRERDEYSSKQVIDLLDCNKDARALIFYGGGHLANYQAKKLQNYNEMGYFMAYYLTEHFKNEGGIYRIDQVQALNNPWVSNTYKISDKNYILELTALDGSPVPDYLFLQPMEATLFLFNNNTKMKHMSRVWSDNLIDCFLNNANKYSNTKSEFNRFVNTEALYYLSIAAGKEPENIDINDSAAVSGAVQKWKAWRTGKKENFADITYKQGVIKNRINLFAASKSPFSARYEYELTTMINAKIMNISGALPEKSAELYNKFLARYSKPIIINDLINLLWVGTEAERTKAVEYLKKETGQKFEDPEEWTEWWRNSEFCM